jgi:secreted trypsin-like serine protease
MEAHRFRGRRQLIAATAGVLAALLLPALASAKGGAQASIVGGRTSTIEEFPSLAYIEVDEGGHGFSCTGTVVAPRIILTAAHCVENLDRGGFTSAGDYAVATGTTNPAETAPQNVFRVADTHVFPGFDPGTLRGDAAILVLSAPTSAPVLPLAGAADTALYAGGASVQLAGWGLIRANSERPTEALRSTSMVVKPSPFCERKTRSYYPPYSPASQLCTLDPPAKKSGGCFGDSGGPAIGQRPDGTPVQLGIISTGGPFCSTQLPNVLTRADFIGGWVAEWVAATETGTPPPLVDPSHPFPLMTRPGAESFASSTLQQHLGRRFERAERVFGGCRRISRSRFRCQVSWRQGRNIYAGVVSPFYVRKRGTVVWDSHFRIEWAPLRCLRSNAPACPIQVRSG